MRTQLERRTATRLALLDATTRCLVERGYAATTTTEVARLAGVSQGAVFKHFASKDVLLAAVAEHLYDGLIARYLDRFRRLERTADHADRLDQSVRLLWQLFCTDEMAAALELEVVARTDPGLRAGLAPVIERHAARIRTVAATLFPDVGDAPAFAAVLDLVLETMHGMAASRATTRDAVHERRLLVLLQDVARRATLPEPHLPRPR